jgi:hypothetical protein
MPFILPFVPLIAAGVGVAGIGTSVYEGIKSSDQNSADQAAQKAALLQQQQTQANQANLTKQEAVLGASGQEQQQTGGSLTDSGTSALTDLLAGYPGYQAGSGTSTGTGVGSSGISGASTSAPGSTGTPDIASILAVLRNSGSGGLGLNGLGTSGNIFGGNWQSQPAAPQTQFELANPLV